MRHQPLREVQQLAEIQGPAQTRGPLSRSERFERWVALLEDHPGALNTLEGTEYKAPEKRALMRCDDSPLSVAFRDPVLREDGLAGDTYGDAMSYFGLSNHQMHYIVCHCHCGSRMSGRDAAERVRSIMPGRGLVSGLIGALRRWLH